MRTYSKKVTLRNFLITDDEEFLEYKRSVKESVKLILFIIHKL